MSMMKNVTIYNGISSVPESFRGSGEMKAIVLGTDPTSIDQKTQKIKSLRKVFDIEGDKRYFANIKANLNEIFGKYLNDSNSSIMECLYVQNLCTNYLEYPTCKYSRKAWCHFIKDNGYIEKLQEDLNKIPLEVPVFITAEILLDILKIKEDSERNASYYYKNSKFIKSDENVLNRLLIPFFRHWSYNIKRWPLYKEAIEFQLSTLVFKKK